jgi:dihydromethanopterin reductase
MPAQVRSMCAIGLSGQLGLDGRLPWEGDRRPEFVADVARFFQLTQGHVLLAGPKTVSAIPSFALAERTVVTIRSGDDPRSMLERFPGRVVYIGGGPPVWDVYAPFIEHWDVTRLPYDGPADRWFDPRWLLTGAHAEVR